VTSFGQRIDARSSEAMGTDVQVRGSNLSPLGRSATTWDLWPTVELIRSIAFGMNIPLVIQVLLFALSAILPIWGIYRIYRGTQRKVGHLTSVAKLVYENSPEGTQFPTTVAEDIKQSGLATNFPWSEDIAAGARKLEGLRGDFLWIGAGVLCGAVASIWSLIEAAV